MLASLIVSYLCVVALAPSQQLTHYDPEKAESLSAQGSPNASTTPSRLSQSGDNKPSTSPPGSPVKHNMPSPVPSHSSTTSDASSRVSSSEAMARSPPDHSMYKESPQALGTIEENRRSWLAGQPTRGTFCVVTIIGHLLYNLGH